jgi:hypothetical protein
MGPFEWLASRWTPEFEYRDRLADEVEDIAFESTRTGTRRGFLFGVLVGAVLAVLGAAVLAGSGVRVPLLSGVGPRDGRVDQGAAEPAAEELNMLRYENEQLKKELAKVRVTAPAGREKRAVDTKPVRPRADAPAEVAPREKRAVEPRPSEARAEGVAAPPREKQVGERAAMPAGTETAVPQPGRVTPRETAVKREQKTKTQESVAPQPIPSNCRSEGDCDPVGL